MSFYQFRKKYYENIVNTDERKKAEEEREKNEFYCCLTRNGDTITCCVDKPITYIKSRYGEIIGSIKEPYSKSRYVILVLNEKKEIKYRIESSCFQMGICFRNSLLGKCLETFFYVYKADNDSKLEGYKDGLITKKFSACANDDDLEYPEAMEIIFPDDAKIEDKFLLLCVGVMIDYLLYNLNPNDLQEK